MRVALLAIPLVLVSACARGADPGPARDGAGVTGPTWSGVFAAFPGARRLCSQHVSGNGMHIEWTAYATDRPIAEVVAFYEKNRGSHAFERDGAGCKLRAPSEWVLSVHPKDGSYPRCEEGPAAGDATVIIVSHAIR